MRRTAFLALVATMIALVTGPVQAAPTTTMAPPEVIALPNGFQPEGIARGQGTTFFTGSLRNGAIFRGDLQTGKGSVFVRGAEGRVAAGMEVDDRNRLWVAGGGTGKARVYDAASGRLLKAFSLAKPPNAFVNDVVVTDRAAYFTDSFAARLFVVPIGDGGRLGEPRILKLSGDLKIKSGFNLNGIAASADGSMLIAVQTNTGLLFRINPKTGATRQVDVVGGSLVNGDGLLRVGSILYVVRNQNNQIAAVRLSDSFLSGRVIDRLTDPDLDVPTGVTALGRFLFAVNARFLAHPTPQDKYAVVRVDTR